MFKFPSKTFPRSSYYVTSTEIIIRIKKARKKWKLVVPKKRLVSYRTNRWFAKPRWVEIELTFTQALKLGLVEPRPAGQETQGVLPASAPIVLEPDPNDAAGSGIPDGAAASLPQSTDGGDATSESGIEVAETAADEEEEIAAPEVWDTDESSKADADAEADADSAEDFSSCEEPGLGFVADAIDDEVRAPVRVGAVSIPDRSDRLQPPPVVAVPAARQSNTAGRTGAALMATLALGLAGVSGHLLMRGEPAAPGLASGPACAAPGEVGQCTQDFVTGSIDKAVRHVPPPREAAQVTAAHERAGPPDERLETERVEADQIDALVEMPPPRADDAGKVVQAVPGGETVSGSAGEPLPPASTAACGDIAVAARAIRIQFDYASWHVDRGVMPALGSFAGQLQSCPSARVVIEGHTDGDGHADRNQALSLRRADAVRELLVEAGARPDQLVAIGFGQTRPHVPNVSTENKRRNRRAALVVEPDGGEMRPR